MPLEKEDWGFFDRQRSIFSSMFKDMDDEFKEFDKELEKMKREMFQLKVKPTVCFGTRVGRKEPRRPWWWWGGGWRKLIVCISV